MGAGGDGKVRGFLLEDLSREMGAVGGTWTQKETLGQSTLAI